MSFDTFSRFGLVLLIKKIFMFVDNVDLGTACGKYYRVCCLSIIDPGIGCLLSFSSILETGCDIFVFLMLFFFCIFRRF